ncbi:MAG: hypothetical protein EOO75_10735, partial [Myxococcales bacterium]
IMGDVGSFSLQAQVEPRKVEAGGSVAVTAVLRGTGNPPAALRLPERKGVSWLEPETRETIETGEGTVTGTRTFTYLVKMSEPGAIDLGDLSVSFWNPKLKEYQTARAALGQVEVAPGSDPAAVAAAAGSSAASRGVADPFAAIAPARAAAGAYAPPGTPLSDRPWFWALLLGAPAAVVLAQGATSAAGGWKKRRLQHDEAATTRARKALGEARECEQKGDHPGSAAALERAIVAAVEGAAGVRLRALLTRDIGPRLRDAGLPGEDADEVAALIGECEHQRFLPGGGAIDQALCDRVAALLRRLGS